MPDIDYKYDFTKGFGEKVYTGATQIPVTEIVNTNTYTVTIENLIFDKLRSMLEESYDKWTKEHDDSHTPAEWASFITNYATKSIMKESLPFSSELVSEFRENLLKVAVIAIAAVTSIDRQRNDNRKTFYEDAFKR